MDPDAWFPAPHYTLVGRRLARRLLIADDRAVSDKECIRAVRRWFFPWLRYEVAIPPQFDRAFCSWTCRWNQGTAPGGAARTILLCGAMAFMLSLDR